MSYPETTTMATASAFNLPTMVVEMFFRKVLTQTGRCGILINA